MQTIDSIKDLRVIAARELSVSKNRVARQACLLEGIESITYAWEALLPIEHVFVHDKALAHSFVKELEKRNISCFSVSEGILKKITDTNYLVPFVGVASVNKLFVTSPAEFMLVLDNLVDYGNIGTIIRTAVAFDIHRICFTNSTTDPFFKKTIDASRGAAFMAHYQRFQTGIEMIATLKQEGYQVIATSPHGAALQVLTRLKELPVALVIGNETDGCSTEVLAAADVVVQIPMSPAVESLNVAVAAGISIYELRLKLVIAMIMQKIIGTLGRNLGVAHQLIRQVLDTELKKVSTLSSTQYIVLMVLAVDRNVSYADITRDFGIQKTEIDSFLLPLITDGYIKKEAGKDVVGIMPAGEELIAKLWPLQQRVEHAILENFSEQEKVQLQAMLKRIQDNCQKILAS